MDAAGFARELDDARREGRTLDALLTDRGLTTLPAAYAVQRALTQRRLDRGESVVGWKLGYTALAMRAQMGIDEPNFGPLTDAMILPDGSRSVASLPTTALQPRVEPEIAVRLASTIAPGATEAEALACIGSAHACLEVVDSVWTGYRFTLLDNTADGSSAGWVVLGAEIDRGDLAGVGVELSEAGRAIAEATGAAAGGHPVRGLIWLADQLADDPRGLRPDDVVITGGLTAAHPLRPGHTVSARFDATVVSVSR